MRNIMLAISFVCLSISVSGQTQTGAGAVPACQLDLSHAPAVRGIKLAMKLDDVLVLFPGIEQDLTVKYAVENRVTYPNLGIFRFQVDPRAYPTKDQFRGINQVSFSFLDDRLAHFYVEYASPPAAPAWPLLDDGSRRCRPRSVCRTFPTGRARRRPARIAF